MPEVNIDTVEIMKTLPHRHPFLLVDKIIEHEPRKRAVGIKNVTFDESFFAGHFPGLPVMPGVLIVEALAQVGAWAVLLQPENKGKVAFFAGIDNVRFRKPVVPGDQLRLEVELLKGRANLLKMKGVALVNGAPVCEGELMCSIISPAQQQEGSAEIDGTAVVHPTAKLGKGVRIGAYSIIGEDVEIGDNTMIGTSVVVSRWTKIGKDCRISHGTTIGTPPQDHKYRGEKSWVVIGDRCQIREFVTIHLPTGEGNTTRIGNDVMIQIYSHIPHNANIGNNVVIAGYVAMAGHAQIDDYAIIGGMTTIHQFVRIGKMAMIGGNSRIAKDIPPFMLAEGNPMQVRALNSVGLMRRGVSAESQNELKKAFKILFKSGLNLTQAIFELKKKLNVSYPEISYLIEFLEQETDRGILKKMEASDNDDLLLPDLPELGI